MEQRKVCGQQGEVGNNEEVKIENQPPQIQTECQELGKADTFEHCFIKQEDEDDKHTETTEVLNRIKSEPNYVDCDPEYKNILEMEIENNKLDMEMQSQEFIFKDDSDKNIDTITGIDSSRIKSEYSSIDNFNQCGTSENEDLKFQLSGMKPEVDMDTEEFEAGEITEEFAIKVKMKQVWMQPQTYLQTGLLLKLIPAYRAMKRLEVYQHLMVT
ncbi:unnamed protein product [Callosobruchus maculatus]|uniref:Uncharacterized protein n=1 Tax=Callosobruchus maculatus TaxID=64391 RepID=A0A653DKE5_CALMS|nr:unnamed protein product [Callosobruchus maculatus]